MAREQFLQSHRGHPPYSGGCLAEEEGALGGSPGLSSSQQLWGARGAQGIAPISPTFSSATPAGTAEATLHSACWTETAPKTMGAR